MTRLITGTTLALLALGALALLALGALAACKYPYPGNVDDRDATAACTPSTTACTDDTLVVCDAAGHPSSTTACPFGCFASGDRCADLDPSNGLAPYLDQARTAQPIMLSDPAILDTDSGQLMNVVTGQGVRSRPRSW